MQPVLNKIPADIWFSNLQARQHSILVYTKKIVFLNKAYQDIYKRKIYCVALAKSDNFLTFNFFLDGLYFGGASTVSKNCHPKIPIAIFYLTSFVRYFIAYAKFGAHIRIRPRGVYITSYMITIIFSLPIYRCQTPTYFCIK